MSDQQADIDTAAQPTPVHDPAASCFRLEGIEGARLEYELDEQAKILDLKHTLSPPEYRGRGFAALMVAYAFEYAKEHGLRVRPTCSYIPAFLKRNPQYQALATPATLSAI